MSRFTLVGVLSTFIWLSAGVVVAAPQDNRGDWSRVTTLQANQKVTVEPHKGKGKKTKGLLVASDQNSITVVKGNGEVLVVPRADVRRVAAVRVGREDFGTIGALVIIGGAVAEAVLTVNDINRCTTLACTFKPRVGFKLIGGAITTAGVVLSGMGAARRVYEAQQIPGRVAAPSNSFLDPGTAQASSGPLPAIDTVRIVAALKQPAGRLRLALPMDTSCVVGDIERMIPADHQVFTITAR